jgi:hypothetical protein
MPNKASHIALIHRKKMKVPTKDLKIDKTGPIFVVFDKTDLVRF